MSGSRPHNFSPSRALSPHMRTTHETDSPYLAALRAEFQKLGPFRQVLPICTRLLNQEIFRVTGTDAHQVLSNLNVLKVQHGSPSPIPMISPDILPRTLPLSNQLYEQLFGSPVGMNIDWVAAPMSPSSYMVKKILRLEIPVDRYPNFNFVGRLLGPRGNSLKRVEASTGCRIYIRGKGSIKHPEKEESLRGKPGYEHLTEPLHVLIEAEFTANVVDIQLRQAQEIIQELLKPVDESYDIYKRQQLKELAMLNSGLREENPFSSNVTRLTETDKKYDAVESTH